MKLFETIGRKLRFDEPDGRFELLETEAGQPSFFHGQNQPPVPEMRDERPVPRRLKESRRRLAAAFFTEVNTDLILRAFRFCGSVDALAVFLNGMADGEEISDFILKQAMAAPRPTRGQNLVDYALHQVFSLQEAERTDRWAQVVSAILEGRTAVLLEGAGEAVAAAGVAVACSAGRRAPDASAAAGAAPVPCRAAAGEAAAVRKVEGRSRQRGARRARSSRGGAPNRVP